MQQKLLILLISVSIFLTQSVVISFAGDFEGSSNVNADVEVSVCGDGIVEGPEQCEPLVPVTMSCKDIGYDKGSLSCDPSCSFNQINCEYVAPKPILPPFPNIFDPDDEEPDKVVSYLPFFLELYDTNLDGKLTIQEYCVGLTYWLKKWKLRLINEQPEADIGRIAGAKDTCDLNFDGNCNLVDFSIFLHNAE